MGITIHYKAHIEINDGYLITKVLKYIKDEAKKTGYEIQVNDRNGYVHEENVYNQKNEIVHQWFSFSEREYDNSKPSTIREIIVHNKINGVYMSESFCCGFFLNPFTKRYEWSDFTKTQIFNK